MSAPDAQPPAELSDVNPHWSPTTGLLWWEDGTYVTVEDGEIVEDGLALPADAVRLVPATQLPCPASLVGVYKDRYVCARETPHDGSRAEPHATTSGVQWWTDDNAIRPASAALAGTPALTADRAHLFPGDPEERRSVAHDMSLTRNSHLAAEIRRLRALLASTPTEETDHVH